MSRIISYLPRIFKAVTAFIGAVTAEYALAELITSPGAEVVTMGEWAFIIVSALVVAYGVWQTPNAGTSTPSS